MMREVGREQEQWSEREMDGEGGVLGELGGQEGGARGRKGILEQHAYCFYNWY